MIRILVILTLLFSIDLFSFPISIRENWKVKEGIHLNSIPDDSWTNYPKASIKLKNVQPRSGNLATYTFTNEVELPDLDYSRLRDSISILIPNIMNVFELYFDGELILKRGEIKDDRIIHYGYKRNIISILPYSLLKSGTHRITILISSQVHEDIVLDGNENMTLDYHSKHEEVISERIPLMLIFMYLFVGFYHLLLYLKRTQEKYNLIFSLFCFDIFIYLILRTDAIYSLELDPFLLSRLEYMFLFVLSPFALMFFQYFFEHRIGKFTRVLFVTLASLGISTLFLSRHLASKILLLWQLISLACFIYFFVIFFRALRNKHMDARRLFLTFVIFLSLAILDVIGSINLVPGIVNLETMKYGFFLFIIGIAFVLANRFLRLHKEVEDLNTNLESKVKERTQELQNTLDEVRALKFQQDGDYFLTTLLLSPLMVNQAESEYVNIEFYIKQKKNFLFKNKNYEIGGDICISDTIELRQEKYIAFVNGDAMGKSIQGAGGALVLGVIFKSILERTKSFGKQMNSSPERWLKNCFSELHDVFISFEGSMLISVVMGIIEEKTGVVYFINAEHPFTILYRDGKADFLETKLMHHKIGMQGLEGSLRVQCFPMERYDSLIIGSDGRDDIVLQSDGKGNRVINEDDNLFLSKVEKGNGDLNLITKLLLQEGELSDDYTLLKVEYIGAEEESPPENYLSLMEKADMETDKSKKMDLYKQAHSIYRSVTVLEKLALNALSEKNDSEFLNYGEELVRMKPSLSQMYFEVSKSHLKLGNFNRAADFGESLKLRNPENIENTINLIQIYREMKNSERAIELVNRGLYYSPENETLRTLKNDLEYELHRI